MNLNINFIQVDDDPELLEKTYRLRYDVYCEETGFLNPHEYQDKIETDAYDLLNRSLHFAALDGEKNLVGSIRLILNSDLPFPLEKMCPSLFINTDNIPKNNIAEISRLVIQKAKRRRPEDGLFGIESYLSPKKGGRLSDASSSSSKMVQHVHERRNKPVIILGLYRAMYHASKKHGLAFWYASMEKKLWYALKRFAFPFVPIGPEIDYYGPVIPYLGEIKEIEKTVLKSNPKIMKYMLEGLEKKYFPEIVSRRKRQLHHIHK